MYTVQNSTGTSAVLSYVSRAGDQVRAFAHQRTMCGRCPGRLAFTWSLVNSFALLHPALDAKRVPVCRVFLAQ